MIPADPPRLEDRIARDRRLLFVVLLLVLGLTITELFLLALLVEHVSKACPAATRPSLPCAAIPTRLILEDPACAQRLLTVMNVTNVHILTNVSQLPDLDPAMKARLAALGAPLGGNRSS